MAGVSEVQSEDGGKLLRLQVAGPIGELIKVAARHDLLDVVSREPNLEDVFLAHYGHGADEGAAVAAKHGA